MTFLESRLNTRATLTVDFESSLAAFAIDASKLAIPEAFAKAVSGMFEKLKTTWTTGSDAVGGFSEGAAGLTEAFAEGEGVKVIEDIAGLGPQIVSVVGLHAILTTCELEHVLQALQMIKSAVAEHVPPL